jgi:hypothetical protein
MDGVGGGSDEVYLHTCDKQTFSSILTKGFDDFNHPPRNVQK